MEKNILIFCCGYPYTTDTGFGYHVAQALEKIPLPDNVELMEVGESASMFPALIEGRDKLIIIDSFQTNDTPGTVVRLMTDDVPITVNKVTDVPKFHLIETLTQIKLIGRCPETIFIGVVPKDVTTESQNLTPEIEQRIPDVIALLMKEIRPSSEK